MATTKLERAVDNYVDSLTTQELREFVFNQLLGNFKNKNQLNDYLFNKMVNEVIDKNKLKIK
tara:strand:+ start:125 stop:310 length:186 start_codon:yes stop_codon:yes gene_type:complete